MQSTFNGVGVEVDIKDPKNFLKIRETLTRIGIASSKDSTLYQSCHILHKRGEYAILHFKELFILDGKIQETIIDDDDYVRRDTIVKLLEKWELLNIKDVNFSSTNLPLSEIKIISFKDKDKWNLVPKYTIGQKKSDIDIKKSK